MNNSDTDVSTTDILKDQNISTRALIAQVGSLPKQTIEEISPRSLSLQKNLKAPLVLMCWSIGLITALNLVFIKCFGEIVRSGEVKEKPILSSVCFFFGATGSLMMIYVLNIAMRYYDNIDVIPIFQSFNLLMMMASGWVVMDEARFYTPLQIVGILSSSMIVCAGIKVLTMKQTTLQTGKGEQISALKHSEV